MKNALHLLGLVALTLPVLADSIVEDNSVLKEATGLLERANEVSDKEVPVFDPTKASISFLGKKFRLQDTRAQLHFESYLADNEYQSKEAKLYQGRIKKIKSILHSRSQKKNRVEVAYALLRKAARYKGDHRVSESLGSAVNAALLSLEFIEKKRIENVLLDEKYAKILRKRNFVESPSQLKTKRKVTKPKKGPVRRPSTPKDDVKDSTEYVELTRQMSAIELQKKKNELAGVKALAQAKLNFQSMLAQLFMQRRFEHVVMGCRFYSHLFKGDNRIALKKGSRMAMFFCDSLGVEPNVTGLESLALEFIKKIDDLVSVSENFVRKGELHAGSSRLLEAYTMGEHLICIHTLSGEKKSKIYQYSKLSNHLLDAMKSKDFGKAKLLNQKLKSVAKDYRYVKTEADVSRSVSASNAHVTQALLYLAKEQKELMFEEIKKARSVWPLNPKIDDLYKTINGELK